MWRGLGNNNRTRFTLLFGLLIFIIVTFVLYSPSSSSWRDRSNCPESATKPQIVDEHDEEGHVHLDDVVAHYETALHKATEASKLLREKDEVKISSLEKDLAAERSRADLLEREYKLKLEGMMKSIAQMQQEKNQKEMKEEKEEKDDTNHESEKTEEDETTEQHGATGNDDESSARGARFAQFRSVAEQLRRGTVNETTRVRWMERKKLFHFHTPIHRHNSVVFICYCSLHFSLSLSLSLSLIFINTHTSPSFSLSSLLPVS